MGKRRRKPGELQASKETCAAAARLLGKIRQVLDSPGASGISAQDRERVADGITCIEMFLAAALKRLPHEATYQKREQRKQAERGLAS